MGRERERVHERAEGDGTRDCPGFEVDCIHESGDGDDAAGSCSDGGLVRFW